MFAPDVILGQYINNDTFIHKLDPGIKLISLLILAASALYWVSGCVIVFLVLLILVNSSQISHKLVFKWIRSVKWFLIITFFFHALATPGFFVPRLSFGDWGITYEGLYNGSLMCARITELLIASSLLTQTTSPARLADGLEKLFSPLKKIGLPIQDMAMMITLSLHFIPILWIEADHIRKALIARGINFSRGNFIERVKRLIPMITPLIMNAFQRADNLALAMDIRYYHSKRPRTSLYSEPLRLLDYMILAGAFIIPITALLIEKKYNFK